MNTFKTFVLLAIFALTVRNCDAIITASLSPSSVNIAPNTSFTLTLRISATEGEELTSVGYRLSVSAPGSGLFAITSRDITGSPFTFLTSTDSQITSIGDSAGPAGADNLLNTENDRDLGGSTSDPFAPTTGSGPFLVNVLTLSSTATSGNFVFSLFPGANVGFGDPLSPSSQPILATASVNVPEPSVVTLLVAGFCAVCVTAHRKKFNKTV